MTFSASVLNNENTERGHAKRMSEYLYPTDTELFLEDVVNLYTHLCAPFFFNMKETTFGRQRYSFFGHGGTQKFPAISRTKVHSILPRIFAA